MPSPVDNLTDALLGPILAADPAGPRVTYYDDATGERIELSASTLPTGRQRQRIWSATSSLSRRAAKLPCCFPRTGRASPSCWVCGGQAVRWSSPPDADAELAFVTADRLDDVADVPEVAALSLDAFGKGLSDLPLGVADYATSIRVHGDQFRSAGAGSALEGRSVADTIDAARASAKNVELVSTDRVLSSRTWDTADELIDGLLAVLAAGASLVQVAHPDAEATARRVGTEKVTKQF